ncbi:MAG TPA: flagellar basal body P-ring formation chaperone FlgA [Opitutaceae bacterium]
MNRVLHSLLRAALPLAFVGFALLRADTLPPSSAPAAAAVEAANVNRTPLTREILLSSLSEAIAGHFNLEGELQLELIRPWSPPERVAGAWSISVIEHPSFAASSMMLRCRVLADGESVVETTFVVRAQLWRDAWVTRQPLTIGAPFDASMLEARRVDLFRDRDALPAAVGDRSYIFARAVTAGRLLTWRDISRRPLVRKGDLVDVTAVDGLLAVTMKGVAMQNGAQGDTVTVRNPESRKDFAAMVIDENRVQVRF